MPSPRINIDLTSEDYEVVLLGDGHAEYLWLADNCSGITTELWIFSLDVAEGAGDR